MSGRGYRKRNSQYSNPTHVTEDEVVNQLKESELIQSANPLKAFEISFKACYGSILERGGRKWEVWKAEETTRILSTTLYAMAEVYKKEHQPFQAFFRTIHAAVIAWLPTDAAFTIPDLMIMSNISTLFSQYLKAVSFHTLLLVSLQESQASVHHEAYAVFNSLLLPIGHVLTMLPKELGLSLFLQVKQAIWFQPIALKFGHATVPQLYSSLMNPALYPPLAHTPPPLSQIFHPGIYPPTEVVLSDSNIESLRSEEIKTKPDPLSGDDNSNVPIESLDALHPSFDNDISREMVCSPGVQSPYPSLSHIEDPSPATFKNATAAFIPTRPFQAVQRMPNPTRLKAPPTKPTCQDVSPQTTSDTVKKEEEATHKRSRSIVSPEPDFYSRSRSAMSPMVKWEDPFSSFIDESSNETDEMWAEIMTSSKMSRKRRMQAHIEPVMKYPPEDEDSPEPPDWSKVYRTRRKMRVDDDMEWMEVEPTEKSRKRKPATSKQQADTLEDLHDFDISTDVPHYCTDFKLLDKQYECDPRLIPRAGVPDEFVSIRAKVPVIARGPKMVSPAAKKKTVSTGRKTLSKHATETLNNWFLGHIESPYPDDETKKWLAKKAECTTAQINNWFGNRRIRYKRGLEEVAMGIKDKDDDGPRRRRNLPKEHSFDGWTDYIRSSPLRTSDILNDWFYAHLDMPYPNERDKNQLCIDANVSQLQLNNWFSNKRIRYLRQTQNGGRRKYGLG